MKYTQYELNEILKNHKLWLNSYGEKGKKADLSYADLSNADLRNDDLSNANLYNANLRNTDLRNADLRNAVLCSANLNNANLYNANLRKADLRNADLDFSAISLWCGGLDVHIDDRQATQLLYHLVRNVLFSKNTSKAIKRLCSIKSIVNQANKFHRVEECREIEVKR